MESAENAGSVKSAAIYTGVVDTRNGTLNIRSEPGGGVIAQAARGEEVMVLADEGEWLFVRAAAGDGYVSKRFIRWKAASQDARMVIVDEAGLAFTPSGSFMVRLATGPID